MLSRAVLYVSYHMKTIIYYYLIHQFESNNQDFKMSPV